MLCRASLEYKRLKSFPKQTGSFGYYNFQGLPPGLHYTVTVTTKKYVLTQPTRMIVLQSNVGDFDFVAEPL